MKLIVMDRDGTINQDSDHFIKSPDEWHALPGALEAIARLNHAGWQVVVASNQSGLGRGLFDMAALNQIHRKLQQQLAAHGGRIEAFFFCPHSADEHCSCRKPLPGLFEQIGERYGLDMAGVPTVGDNLRDLLAGTAAGCEPHLVLTGKAVIYRDQALPASFPAGTRLHDNLGAFADFLIAREAQLTGADPFGNEAQPSAFF